MPEGGNERMTEKSLSRLAAVTVDTSSLGHGGAEVEHERATAIWDLIEENSFHPCGDPGEGPYTLHISLMDNRLVLDIKRENGEQVVQHHLSLTPFRKVVKDYFLICESYYAAIRTASPSQIEAIDMGRRGAHNEGSELLQERLKGKIDVDFDTARRLFTLICALHWKG